MEIPAETLIAQQLAYAFLGKVFYEPPTAAFVQRLVDDDLFADWPLESTDPKVQAGLEQLRTFSAQWDDTQFDEIRRDYARLFVGPNRLLAPPWESVYRSREHLIFEQQTLEVRQQYNRYGMVIQHEHVEPDDHMGLELRFMAHLNGLALYAFEQGDAALGSEALAAMGSFLSEHLLQWSPEFLGHVMSSATTAYYQAAAQLTLGCLYHTASVLSAEQPVP